MNDEQLLGRVIAEHGVTRIIHLAALQIPFVRADPARGALVNVAGTVRILEAARRLGDDLEGFAYASSSAAYGPPGAGLRPETLYGVFKRTNEESARLYWNDFGVASVGLRPWAVFGPGRDQGMTAAPTHALKAAVLGLRYTIPFGGRVDLQHVRDVAETFILAACSGHRGADVCDLKGNLVSVEEFVDVIEAEWPEARGLVDWQGEQIPIDPDLDDSRLRALIGEPPRTDLKVAVRDTLAFFAAQRDEGVLTALPA